MVALMPFLLLGDFGMEKYSKKLRLFVEKNHLSDSVVFTGKCSFSDVIAYYRMANIFLCMSEHEGFCVPLAEAMYFNIPVVAYNAAAVPDTLDGSGILLQSTAPEQAAQAMNALHTDDALREKVLAAQKARLDDFSYEAVKEKMLGVIRLVEQMPTESAQHTAGDGKESSF